MDKSSIRPTTKKVRKNTDIEHGEKVGGSYDRGHGVRVVEWSFVEFRMKWHKL